ncbi:MAG: hypothetical protein EP330_11415 [Deltaproteobacteria bacterium]|nr:MAG: hypothetical protein EP330_11415 [Deltaproteobacteria bacterium]
MPTLDPTLARRIADEPDPVIRNLQITWGYAQLASALSARLGPPDVPWPAFGVWASKTAGRFIRGEGLPPLVEDLVDGLKDRIDPIANRLPRRIRPDVHRLPSKLLHAVTDDVAAQLALGNQRIWAELGPLLLEAESHLDDPRADYEAWIETRVEPGATERGGQALLRQALVCLGSASRTTDPKRRAERIFAFNAYTGFHEQIRIDAQVDAALDAPVRTLARVLAEGDDDDSWLEDLAEAAVLRALEPVLAALSTQVRRRMTRHVMTFDLPGQSMPLGRDVPAAGFPTALAELLEPEALLVAGLVDRTPDTVAGSAARDWSVLGDRMHFITDVFRSHQHRPELLHAPYAEAQVAELLAGRLPEGSL